MVLDDQDNANKSPTSSGPKFKSSATSNENFDVMVAINRLVDAVEYSVSNYKSQDRAQLFGDQFACFLRGLNDLQFYDATIYASIYMRDVTEKQKTAEKGTNP